MRRLGFLEVLLCDCASSDRVTQETVGNMLWELARKNQEMWLRKLGEQRGFGREVGKISNRIAGRYVKLGAELELLTEGPLKTLTDLGRLFRLFRKEPFYINLNIGQQIILIREFLRKDNLMFPKIMEYIVKSGSLSVKDIFDWFANKFTEEIMTRKDINAQLLKRFHSTISSYCSEDKKTRRRGYDKVKHIVIPRLENIVDLELVNKKLGPVYACSSKGEMIYHCICQPLIRGASLTDDDIFERLAKVYDISNRATLSAVLRQTLRGFEMLAEPPLKVVPTRVLQDFVCIHSIASRDFLILPKDVEKIEKFLSKRFYGKVVFFENMEGRVSHISVPDEIKKKLLANTENYASQIGE